MARNAARMANDLIISSRRASVWFICACISAVGVLSFTLTFFLFGFAIISAVVIISITVVAVVRVAVITAVIIPAFGFAIPVVRVVAVISERRFSFSATKTIPGVLLPLESCLHCVRVGDNVPVVRKKVFFLDLIKSILLTSLEAFALKLVPRLGVGFIFNGNPSAVEPSVVLAQNFRGITEIVVHHVKKLSSGGVLREFLFEHVEDLRYDGKLLSK